MTNYRSIDIDNTALRTTINDAAIVYGLDGARVLVVRIEVGVVVIDKVRDAKRGIRLDYKVNIERG